MFKKDFLNTGKKVKRVRFTFGKSFYFILTFILYLFLVWFFTFVTAKETVSVVTGDFNTSPTLHYPGWHLYNPFSEKITHYETKPVIIDKVFFAKTLDNKDVQVKFNISFKINPSEYLVISKGFNTVQEFVDKVLVSTVHELIVAEIGKTKLKSLQEDSETVKSKISNTTTRQFDKTKIRLLYLFIVDIQVTT